jgi:hypothetical protein
MMDTANQLPAAPVSSPFQLAAPVSDRAIFEAVFLTECKSWRTPDADIGQEGVQTNIEVYNTEVGADADRKKIIVRPFLRFTATRVTEKETTVLLCVEAVFALIYAIDTFDNIDEQNIRAFASTSGLFHAWPYWREFLQSTLTRMGLPGIVAPLFRLS